MFGRAKLALALTVLAACTTGNADDRWLNRDGRTPSLAESSDCHVQASRLAAARYPDQLERTAPDGTLYRRTNQDRFPAEIRWYETCLRAKGYVRATDIPSKASSG